MSLDFKIAVCDDEDYFRDRIKELLQKYFKENGRSVSIDLYDSGSSFCSDPDNFKAYDVVFLDIGMDAILRKRRKNGVKMEFPFVGGKRQVLLEDIIYIESRSHQLWFERKGVSIVLLDETGQRQHFLLNI